MFADSYFRTMDYQFQSKCLWPIFFFFVAGLNLAKIRANDQTYNSVLHTSVRESAIATATHKFVDY